ncbi:glycoside hydrolase family 3 protein [Desulfonauticus submarinus]
MKKIIILFLAVLVFYPIMCLAENNIKDLIANMIIIGFDGDRINGKEHFQRIFNGYTPGGVILFDRDYHHRDRVKNIRSPKQLKNLTKELRLYAGKPILIAVDQEGGKVARLKPRDGFKETSSAKWIGEHSAEIAKKQYDDLALELKQEGINCDFAPVVDLALNPNNFVIVGLERSYGASPNKVVEMARIFCNALHQQGIVCVLKHFPGHGSSSGDSHKGFVDVSLTWQKQELVPYKILIKEGLADMIMTAHVFNKQLDPIYPATLSKKINTDLLRNKMGFKGVIVSDDLQMKAITSQYSLAQAVSLAINAGVDMLIFGNQLAKISLSEVVDCIYRQVQQGKISLDRIYEANLRIKKIQSKL